MKSHFQIWKPSKNRYFKFSHCQLSENAFCDFIQYFYKDQWKRKHFPVTHVMKILWYKFLSGSVFQSRFITFPILLRCIVVTEKRCTSHWEFLSSFVALFGCLVLLPCFTVFCGLALWHCFTLWPSYISLNCCLTLWPWSMSLWPYVNTLFLPCFLPCFLALFCGLVLWPCFVALLCCLILWPP